VTLPKPPRGFKKSEFNHIETFPLGDTTTYTHNANGSLASVTDARDNTTTCAYNSQYSPAYLISITDPLGHTTSLTYDSVGNRTSGAVCNWIKPALLCKYGHLKRDVAEGVAMSFRLRYEEAAQHPEQLVGPKDRTQANLQQPLDQLADGSYRGVFPISDSLFHNLLSCGYHNGDWTLSTDSQPVQYTWYDGARSASPAAVTVVHKNVTIVSATASGGAGANGEYWLFDPANPNLPLAVTYETDKLTNEAATATLKVYDANRTGDTPLREITASASTDAAGQQITWDGTVNGQLAEKSIYVFDLHVASTATNITDSDDHKSQKTRIASTAAEEVGWDESTGTTTIRFTYRLADDDGQPASSAEIRIYRPDFGLYGAHQCTGLASAQDYSIDVPVVMDEGGVWYFVLCPTDSHHTRDKAHRDRLVVPRNRQVKQPTVGVMWQSDYISTGAWTTNLETAPDMATNAYNCLLANYWTGEFNLGDSDGTSAALKRDDQGGEDDLYFDAVDLAMWVGHGPLDQTDDRPYLLFRDKSRLKWDDIRWGGVTGVKWVGLFTCRFLFEHSHDLAEALSMCQGVHLICGFKSTMTVEPDKGRYWVWHLLGIWGEPAVPVKTAWFLALQDCLVDEAGTVARVIGAKSAENEYVYGVSRLHPSSPPNSYPVGPDPQPYGPGTASLYSYWDYVKQ